MTRMRLRGGCGLRSFSPRVRRCSVVAAAAAVALLAGCSKEVSGPSPKALAVSPNAACNSQLVTPIQLSGSGFSPLPVDTLANAKLEMPAVSLALVQDLAGEPQAGAPIVLPGAQGESLVTWVSDSELGIAVTPELALSPGLYSVTVANPNGNSTTLPEGLLITPPPTVSGISPDIVCFAHPTEVTLRGDFFLRSSGGEPVVHLGEAGFVPASSLADCRPLPGSSGIEACRELHAIVPADLLYHGEAFANAAVVVENPASVACQSTETIILTSVPLPNLENVVADLLCLDQGDVAVAAQGSGFLFIDELGSTLSLGGIELTTTAAPEGCIDVTGPREVVKSCSEIVAAVPEAALEAGAISATVSNPLPAGGVSPSPVAMQIVPAPAITSVVPDLTCVADGARTLTVEGSGFLVVTVGEEIRMPRVTAGALELTPVFSAGDCSAIEGLVEGVETCTRFTIEVPSTTTARAYALTIENPTPAGCSTVPPASFVVADPPVVTSVSPAAVCLNEGDVVLTVSGTGFLEVDGVGPSLTLKEGDAAAFVLIPADAAAMQDCVELAGTTHTPRACNGFTVVLAQDSAAAGVHAYDAFVTNPTPAGCSSNSVTVTRYGPPSTASITPAALCTGGATLTITGSALSSGAAVYLDTIPAASVTVADDGNSAQAFFSSLPVGSYELTFANPGGCTDVFATSVNVGLGPLAFFADPPVVYNGMATQLTVYAKDLHAPITVALVAADGSGSVDLTDVDDTDPAKVLAVVPQETPAGIYHLALNGSGVGCSSALLPSGLEVVGSTDLNLTSVQPSFGWTSSRTAVTIKADSTGGGFAAIPRVYLNPTGVGAGSAVALESVSFLDATTLTAVVPAGLAVETYDFIIVNPDGSVGVSDTDAERFRVMANPPPEVSAVSPGSILNKSGQSVAITGSNFSGPDVTLSCTKIDGTVSTVDPPEDAGATATSVTIVLDASAFSQAFCVVRVTNDDGAFGEFSSLVITKLDQKLFPFTSGPAMNVARRGLVAAAGRASSAARYLYAVGGDTGTAAETLDTVEAAAVDLVGRPGAFALLTEHLDTPRAMAGGVAVGRFIYVIGGTQDGTAALASVERAAILTPDLRPAMTSVDLDVNADGEGLDAGTWSYRVSAVMDTDDAFNPGGETLPSEAFVVRLPELGTYKARVSLEWTAVAGAVGYRVYRSPESFAAMGQERLVKALGNVLSFLDIGEPTNDAAPLAMGALGKWHTPLDATDAPLALAAARRSAGVTYAVKPDGSRFHIYVLGGSDGSAVQKDVQSCTIVVAADGSQSVARNFQVSARQLSSSRQRLGAWWANPQNAPNVLIVAGGATHYTKNYIYGGGGTNATGSVVNTFEAAEIQDWDSGALASFVSFGGGAQMQNQAGFGAVLANNLLYAMGGQGNAPSNSNYQAYICDAASQSGCVGTYAPEVKNWTNTEATLLVPRHLMGVAMESAFIYLLGGATTGGVATSSTEMTAW